MFILSYGFVGVVYSTLSRNELLRLIRHHLFSHVIRIPSSSDHDKYYTQVCLRVVIFIYVFIHAARLKEYPRAPCCRRYYAIFTTEA